MNQAFDSPAPPPAGAEAVSLAALEPEVASAAVTKSCASCHGADGLGREVAAFPKLAGQRADYPAASLEAFALGERHSGIMGPKTNHRGSLVYHVADRVRDAHPAGGVRRRAGDGSHADRRADRLELRRPL